MRKVWISVLLLVVIALVSFQVRAETMSMTTYLPAPNGKYRALSVVQDMTIANDLTVTHKATIVGSMTAATLNATGGLVVQGGQTVWGDLAVAQDVKVIGSIGVNGLSSTMGYPGTMVGGVHALDVYSDGGTIAAGTLFTGNIRSYISRDGDVYGFNDAMAGGNLVVTRTISSNTGNIIAVTGDIVAPAGNVTSGLRMNIAGAVVAGGIIHSDSSISSDQAASVGGSIVSSGGGVAVSGSGNMSVAGDATITGTINGATYGFGGVYQLYACDSTCRVANRFTGGCSCPADFTRVQIGDFVEVGYPCGSGPSYEGKGMVLFTCTR